MSLNLYLYTETEEVASLNWLRNPFGLCQWAEDNFGGEGMLYMVCNQWAYDNGANIDRTLFKSVVDNYWHQISESTTSYFWFNETQYNRFIKPHEKYFPGGILGRIIGSQVTPDNRVGIPLSYFDKELPEPLSLKRRHQQDSTMKEIYVNWFKELVDFADKLQNTLYTFYCEN